MVILRSQHDVQSYWLVVLGTELWKSDFRMLHLFVKQSTFCCEAHVPLLFSQGFTIYLEKSNLALKTISFGFDDLLGFLLAHLKPKLILILFLQVPTELDGFLDHLAEKCFPPQVADRTDHLFLGCFLYPQAAIVVAILAATAPESLI